MFKPPIIFIASILLACNPIQAANERSDADWVFDGYVGLTSDLLSDPAVNKPHREEYEIRLYQFAFKYWLISRTNQSAAPWHWRGSIRLELHRANNPERLRDPAGIASSFIRWTNKSGTSSDRPPRNVQDNSYAVS